MARQSASALRDTVLLWGIHANPPHPLFRLRFSPRLPPAAGCASRGRNRQMRPQGGDELVVVGTGVVGALVGACDPDAVVGGGATGWVRDGELAGDVPGGVVAGGLKGAAVP